MRTIGIGILALLGFFLICLTIYQNPRKTTYIALMTAPPSPPFDHFIAGQGMIESAYKNIPIGSSYSDVITEIYVNVGDFVKKGTTLFKTDTRRFQAQLQEAFTTVLLALQEYKNEAIQFSYYENLINKNAVSKQAYTTAEYKKKIAYQKLEHAKATVHLYKTDIDRSYIKAPIDGEILQLNIRPGQYAYQVLPTKDPLILFGNPDYYHVRIDIDEEDAWRYETGKAAIAYVRGNKKINMPLEYVYTEPYIVPKKSLTGTDIERVDTRVLQVVYRFKKKALPVYLGQLLDVYINAKPHVMANE